MRRAISSPSVTARTTSPSGGAARPGKSARSARWAAGSDSGTPRDHASGQRRYRSRSATDASPYSGVPLRVRICIGFACLPAPHTRRLGAVDDAPLLLASRRPRVPWVALRLADARPLLLTDEAFSGAMPTSVRQLVAEATAVAPLHQPALHYGIHEFAEFTNEVGGVFVTCIASTVRKCLDMPPAHAHVQPGEARPGDGDRGGRLDTRNELNDSQAIPDTPRRALGRCRGLPCARPEISPRAPRPLRCPPREGARTAREP
jgi:hypothetical protein